MPQTAKPFGRSLGDFAPLSPAEDDLVQACATGVLSSFGDRRPETPEAGKSIRADLLRFLALGGDEAVAVHEKGVRVDGAWIEGGLDLVGCHVPRSLLLQNCTINGQLALRDATVKGIRLHGSTVDGISGDRLQCDGDISLRDGFTATGEVRLTGARVGGDLTVSGARLSSGANTCLKLDGARIEGTLMLHDLVAVDGAVSLGGVRTALFTDDLSTCDKIVELKLDGFQYQRLSKDAPADAPTRIKWLLKQRPGHLIEDFRAQPWEHLIQVLREMGHEEDARNIAIAKQVQLRKAGKYRALGHPLHWIYGLVAGYGFRPMRTVCWMVGLWLISAVAFQYGADKGWMGPTHPLIHKDKALAETCRASWANCAAVPPEYTTFQAYMYSLDVILPLVNLQQQNDWGPIVVTTSNQPIHGGVLLRWLMWIEILFGWAASLLLVAALSNLMKQE